MRDGSNLVTPEHLLLGLLRGDDALAARFGLAGIDSVGQQVTNISGAMPTASYLTLSEAARQVMSCAREERQNLSHKHTGTEHLLLGISRSASSAAAALEQRGWSADRIRRLITSQSLTGGWQTG
jgi:ATP-dependent Clp protease ATP-binding subunit ClpC